ncbi:methyltransferase domain-containing protein [Pseudonocardia zijingensis]|jgi:SAM-dependent methyltransferase|uniref:Methyltransferase type 11 domain-containing protein n=1 Tax=Pseudonocardia zijingensis TaxID=153376 RepID=A0ABN1NJT4_9PSEU
MTGMLPFDEAGARRLEAVYTTPDVIGQRREVRRLLALQPGEHVVDIGAGPGLLAVEMAAEVGPDGRVHAVEPGESMRALAAARQRPPDAATVEISPGSADALPLPDASVDAAVCTQVLEYVPDVPGALAEIHRVLRPGGRVLVLDTDWDSIVWHSRDPARTARILAAWDEHLADPHLPRTLGPALRAAGFADVRAEVLPLLNVGYDPHTYSAMNAGTIAGYLEGRPGTDTADVRAWLDDVTSMGDAAFFSLNRYVFLARRPVTPLPASPG